MHFRYYLVTWSFSVSLVEGSGEVGRPTYKYIVVSPASGGHMYLSDRVWYCFVMSIYIPQDLNEEVLIQ